MVFPVKELGQSSIYRIIREKAPLESDDDQQIADGWHSLPFNRARKAYGWEKAPGRRELIKGLFEEDNPLPAARLIREYIHFRDFVSEREYREGEIRSIGYYHPNPYLFSGNLQVREAFASYPLQPNSS